MKEFVERGWKTIRETVVNGKAETTRQNHDIHDRSSQLPNSGAPNFDISTD